MVPLAIRDGRLSGSITLQTISQGEAPRLCAISMTFGSTSRRLLSTSRAMNGNAAITSGTMEAVVPTDVPTIHRVSGITKIIRIRNGIERSRFTTTSSVRSSHLGSGRIPPFCPVTSNTPSGSPITMAKKVARSVT